MGDGTEKWCPPSAPESLLEIERGVWRIVDCLMDGSRIPEDEFALPLLQGLVAAINGRLDASLEERVQRKMLMREHKDMQAVAAMVHWLRHTGRIHTRESVTEMLRAYNEERDE